MLLLQIMRGETIDLRANLTPAVFVPETMNGTDLLASFRTSSVHSAIVVDEYGDVQGLVTLHDLLEAITGEFHTSNREDSWAVQRDDGSWLLDGMLAIPELKDILELKSVVEEERGRYHTLAGMLMQLLGRVPVGDRPRRVGEVALRDHRHGRPADRQGPRDAVDHERRARLTVRSTGFGEAGVPDAARP